MDVRGEFHELGILPFGKKLLASIEHEIGCRWRFWIRKKYLSLLGIELQFLCLSSPYIIRYIGSNIPFNVIKYTGF
jgi:hypothetical protein